jgi:hypothetical protein
VDEISMVSKQHLHAMHKKLALSKLYGSEEPLGGINFVFFGDFLQFPPVAATSLIAPGIGASTICADLVMSSIDVIVELTKQKRQTDEAYLGVLTNIRKRTISDKDVKFLQKYCKMPPLKQIPGSIEPEPISGPYGPCAHDPYGRPSPFLALAHLTAHIWHIMSSPFFNFRGSLNKKAKRSILVMSSRPLKTFYSLSYPPLLRLSSPALRFGALWRGD